MISNVVLIVNLMTGFELFAHNSQFAKHWQFAN